MAAADPPPLGGFGITVSFTADRAVVGVRGEVDLVTAPELAAVLDAVIGRGYISVVLDLDQLAFMDVQGLRAIASGVGRLESVGGTLTIRSAPTLVLRILDITGLTDLLSFENPLPAVDRLGSEQSTSEPGLPDESTSPTWAST